MSARKRIEYVDVAKGIAILSVIVGHTFSAYDPGSLLNRFIYSFHMPLFFILSGFFYRPQDFKTAFGRKVKNLLVPYLIINAVRCLIALEKSGFETMLQGYLFPALYGNGSTPKIALCLFDVKIVGMTWFLIAMFVCQVLYLCLEEFSKKYGTSMWILVILMAVTGMGLNDKVWLPFSIQPAMSALLFYHAGRLMREKKILEEPVRAVPAGILIMGVVIWIVAVFYASLGMHANSYHGAASVLGAIAATYFITQFSKGLYHVPVLGGFLNWCGRNSIYIYCFHAIDKNILLSIKHVVLRFFPLPSTKGALLFSGMRLLFALLGALVFLVVKNLVKELRREQKKKKERQMEMQRRRQQRMQRQRRREIQRR